MDEFWEQNTAMRIQKERLPEITLEQLAYYDGKDGRPAYVAVKNVIYDVTGYKVWLDGAHFGILAGTDASMGFETCHNHVVLEKLNIVGKLVK